MDPRLRNPEVAVHGVDMDAEHYCDVVLVEAPK
jgi:hypothetical protein